MSGYGHIIRFDNAEQYLEAQHRTDRRKSSRASVKEEEVELIIQWFEQRRDRLPERILCHGARHGVECDLFLKRLPNAEVVGTDLFERDHPQVQKWNFQVHKPEFHRRFDVLYSNSLDHAQDPVETAKVWINQVHRLGFVFIAWHEWHLRTRGGDCYGAALHEYIRLWDDVGCLEDVIFFRHGRHRSGARSRMFVLAIRRR